MFMPLCLQEPVGEWEVHVPGSQKPHWLPHCLVLEPVQQVIRVLLLLLESQSWGCRLKHRPYSLLALILVVMTYFSVFSLLVMSTPDSELYEDSIW